MEESIRKPIITTPSISGAVCNFKSAFAGLPLKSHVIDIDYTGNAISGTVVHFPSEFVGIYPLNDVTDSLNGIDYTINKSGLITLSGTSIADVNIIIDIKECVVPSDNGRTIYLNNNFVASTSRLYFYYNNSEADSWLLNVKNRTYSNYSALAGRTINQIRIGIPNGINVDGSLQPFFSVNNNDNTFNIAFPTPIYGGSYDCLTGIVTSNKDSGGGDISPTYQQTATVNLETNLGVNNIFADTGDTTLQYPKFG